MAVVLGCGAAVSVEKWCSRMESNHRPPPYQGGALPTELRERETDLCGRTTGNSMERETGIEPAQSAWKAEVLPLNYSRAGRPLATTTGDAEWWREVDSNHRRREPADLQSAPVGRLGIPPARDIRKGCETARDFDAGAKRCQRNPPL